MTKIELTIDGKKYYAEDYETVLDVCRHNNIFIPTLCYLKNICESSNCRICNVLVNGNKMMPACSLNVQDKMNVITSNKEIENDRIRTIKLLLKKHNYDCVNCTKNGYCNLQTLVKKYNLQDFGTKIKSQIDNSSPCIIRDNSKCILCGRCVSVCSKIQNVYALTKVNRGDKTKIASAFDQCLKESPCIGCGQCSLVCPTGAIVENSEITEVKKVLFDKTKFVCVQIAPSVRVSLSEAFGKDIGTFEEGKMVACLKKLGFDKVFDVSLGADFTTYEESNELLERIKTGKNLPQFSSCCPAWHKYVENNYPDYVKSLSTCKSPTEMLGAIIKNYYSKKEKINPDSIVVVGIMPCTAKKGEKQRAKDVDYVLTTRELARLIEQNNICFNDIEPMPFDTPLSEYSGGGLIYGVTGGVCESVLRYVSNKLSPSSTTSVFEIVRNSAGIKEAKVKFGETNFSLCIVNGLRNASEVMKDIISGKKHFDFMEVMACPGGCLNGGGQIYVDYNKVDVENVKSLRAKSLYESDEKQNIREASQNKSMQAVYNEFFIPNKDFAEKMLHIKK